MNEQSAVSIIDLLRHGEVVGGNRYRGSTDDPLTPGGREQMWTTVGNTCSWDRIISSPLRRCAEFAQELANKYSLPLELDNRLQEIHFGRWEGLTAKELLATEPEAVEQYWTDPVKYPPPDGETLDHFQARVWSAWETYIQPPLVRHLLVVTHGGTMRMILGKVFDVPFRAMLHVEIEHASLSRVGVQHDVTGVVWSSLLSHGLCL